ncbi:MAG: hypothetical protein HXX16_17895 [Bacteroidales bacterium]|nr:hypothetical protein [Bacteroidales bacterium]
MANKISISSYIRQNQIMGYAMIIGQILFAGVSIYLINVNGAYFGKADLNKVFIYLTPLLTLSCIVGGFVFFKSRMKLIKDKTNIIEKLIDYRSALIIRWALFEGPSFFAIMVYIITANLYFLCIVVIIIAIFIITKPSREMLEKDLELSWEEKNQLVE